MYDISESWLPNMIESLDIDSRVHTVKFQCSPGIRKIIQA